MTASENPCGQSFSSLMGFAEAYSEQTPSLFHVLCSKSHPQHCEYSVYGLEGLAKLFSYQYSDINAAHVDIHPDTEYS